MRILLVRALNNSQAVDMIYMNNKGLISQRRVKVISVHEETFQSYCFVRKQPRIFKLENVLSIRPVRSVRRGA